MSIGGNVWGERCLGGSGQGENVLHPVTTGLPQPVTVNSFVHTQTLSRFVNCSARTCLPVYYTLLYVLGINV